MTYTDGFDGLPVPVARRQDARLDVEPRRRHPPGQLFLAQWNHEKALAALKSAPPRKPAQEIMIAARRPQAQCVASLRLCALR